MHTYLLDYYKNQIKYNNNILKKKSNNFNNFRRNVINKFLYSIDDPKNPYSLSFSRTLLKNYFNLDINYKTFELGVPLLNITQYQKRGLKTSLSNKYLQSKNKMAKTSYDNFPSGFKYFTPNKTNMKYNNNRYHNTMI